MTKSELIHRLLRRHPHLLRRDVEAIVSTILNHIGQALENGHRVELRGFGVFFTKERRAKIARNPKTGSRLAVQEKTVPFFKAGQPLLDAINKDHPAAGESLL